MKYRYNKTRLSRALTLVEMVIAMAIMAIVFAAVLPQFRIVYNTWDSRAGAAETIQNGRVLIDHISRNLSKAVKITAVSNLSATNGYIEFEDNEASSFRYDVNSVNDYVEFGPVGSLEDLAGPVSKFQFTCYDANDLDTPLVPVTDPNIIRMVKVKTTLTNSAGMGQDKTFSTCCYIRTNYDTAGAGPVGWWKLDETSGDIAADSSGNGNDGTLINMAGNEWTDGVLSGALEFDGANNHYVDCGMAFIFDITDEITLSAWVKTNDCGDGQHHPYLVKSDNSYGLKHTTTDELEFYVKIDGGGWYLPHYSVNGSFNGVWHHVAGTYDGSQAKLYVDGELEDYVDCTGSIETDFVHKLCIAEEIEHPERDYDGVIDDVRIYNQALGPEEIAALANILRYVDFTEEKAASETTSITIPTPDTSEGDLLIAAVATDGGTSALITPPFGEGWTELDIDDYTGEVTLGAWWKLAGASESGSHQFTWTGDEQAYGWMMHFAGHDSSDPIHDYSTGGEISSTPTSPAVTTTVDNCLILRLGAFDDGNITLDNPGLSGHTAITMDSTAIPQVSYEEFTEAKVTGGDAITISTPGGTGEGDLLIAAVSVDGMSVLFLAPPGGEGWNEIDLGESGNGVTLGVWWKLADTAESPSHQFTFYGTSQAAYGWIMRFTDHDSSAPINISATQTGSSVTPECPSVTTTVSNAMIVRIGGFDDDDVTIDDPGLLGHTAITMDESHSGIGTSSGGAGYEQQTIPGPCGIAEFSLTGAEQWRAVTVAIAPDVVSVGTVSGGAGYVRQLASGGSGTSEFSLGASNQAKTLTIAIKPGSQGGFGGGISP